MDRCINRYINELMIGQMDGWVEGGMDRCINRYINELMIGQMDGWMTSKRTNRLMYGIACINRSRLGGYIACE